MQKSRVGVWELVPWRASRPGLRGTKALGPEGPLDLPLQEELASACKDYLDFVGSHPFSNESFLEGARLGALVLEKAGHWEEANRAIRKVWVELKGDHFQDLHGDFFEGLVADDVLERARANARWGIEARYEGAQGGRVRCGPHPSLKEHSEEAATQLWADAGKGRALLCYDHGQRELSGVISVALARVPKMNPDHSVSEKGRVIWDARPVNAHCHRSRHPPALQPRHDEVAKLILWWQLRYQGWTCCWRKRMSRRHLSGCRCAAVTQGCSLLISQGASSEPLGRLSHSHVQFPHVRLDWGNRQIYDVRLGRKARPCRSCPPRWAVE